MVKAALWCHGGLEMRNRGFKLAGGLEESTVVGSMEGRARRERDGTVKGCQGLSELAAVAASPLAQALLSRFVRRPLHLSETERRGPVRKKRVCCREIRRGSFTTQLSVKPHRHATDPNRAGVAW